MRPQFFVRTLQCLFCVLPVTATQAQCPDNIDFENGSFINWDCRTGVVDHTSGVNKVNWQSTAGLPEADRHDMFGPGDTTLDQYGGFRRHCPNSSGYSVKLGNNAIGKEAEGLFYTFTIPPSNNKFALVYYYAVVLEDPGHTDIQQPRFRARVVDVVTGEEIDCVSFDFTASTALPGFQTNSHVVYRDWTPVTVDLGAYAGKTLRLEFITTDCTLGSHFGYAYVDVNSSCTQMMEGTSFCDADTTMTLKGPFGFRDYIWYNDATFTSVHDTTKNITVTISDAGKTFPLVLVPYAGFGCGDTLYATIKAGSKPLSDAGADQTTCSTKPVTLGGQAAGDYYYLWKPARYLSDAQVKNPVVAPVLKSPTWFYVTTTDTSTGCFETDSTLITPYIVDTSAIAIGKLFYCPNDPVKLQLSVRNAGCDVQWYLGTSEIPGAMQPTYKPSSTGTYWAEVSENGCNDTTRLFDVRINDFPTAQFVADKEFHCIGNPVQFRNQTTYTGSVEPVYKWDFEDGVRSAEQDPVNIFYATGIYNIKLVASLSDCKDSVIIPVNIMKDCHPLVPTAFTPNNDGVNDRLRPVTPGLKSLKRFSVYNRYGNLMFTTTREGESWDGKVNGATAMVAVYVWLLEYIASDGSRRVEKGTVTLIR